MSCTRIAIYLDARLKILALAVNHSESLCPACFIALPSAAVGFHQFSADDIIALRQFISSRIKEAADIRSANYLFF